MMEDELVKIWHSSPNVEQIKFEKSRLMLDVQSGIDRVNRQIKFRDAIEIGTAIVIVVPAFTYTAFQMPNIVTKIGCVFIILWCFYLVYRLRSARSHRSGAFTDNYTEYLHKTREHLLVQKRLLNTVLWWYVLPAQTGVTLFSLGISLDMGNYNALIKMELLGLALGVATIFMNQQAVKKTLKPRLEKIDELIGVMES